MEEWRSRPLAGEHPYAFIDGTYPKRSWGGSHESAGVLVTMGVDGDGRCELIGCAEGLTGSEDSWRGFLPWLGGRGPRGARMVTGDRRRGMVGALEGAFTQAGYQRRTVHLYRAAFSEAPMRKRALVARMPRAVHAQESREAAVARAGEVAAGLEGMRLGVAAKVVREGCLETLTYAGFPMRRWTRIRTNDIVERLDREVRRGTRAVGTFPDGRSALMLVTARPGHIAECEWGRRRYPDVSLLENEEVGA